MHARRCAPLAVFLLLLGSHVRAAEPNAVPLFPFVLPWDDASAGITNVSTLLPRPAGKFGPVVARDGHLFTGNQRFRIVGVNLCFGANFPKHDDAAKVAARLAKFGVNCVRFHHMDMQPPPGGLLQADRITLDPAQLDKLDYLIAQLKDHGIYADLNLHVSRSYPGLPTWERMPSFHKGVDNFDPRAIALQKDYARALLTHRNPYTKNRYVDEPAVAIVEINNENALLHEWWNGELDEMPDPFRAELRGWNAWLTAKYHDTAALKTAWHATNEPLGPESLRNGDFARGLERWNVERHQGAAADAAVTAGPPRALTIRVPTAAKEAWHVQVNQPGLKFQGDHAYTLTFRARADAPRRITVDAMQAHDPWRNLWSTPVALTDSWKTFKFVFRPSEADDNARIGFSSLGASAGTVEFAEVSLRPGGVFGMEPGETLGTLPVVAKADYSRRTPEAQRDWIAFLWDTEDRYWSGMYRFLKDDLKVVAPVLGTQMGWSPAPIQAKLDLIDSHSYWQHPHFPRKQWDPADWVVHNLPMTGRPDGGTLPRLALSRVAGKPFICTEYNHSAPNSYGSETFPLIFAFAALQDWDGVFVFAYSHRHDDWNEGRITSFFDVDQHPTKMATLPAAATLFLRGDVPARPASVAFVPPAAALDAVRRSGPALHADQFGLTRDSALLGPVALGLSSTLKPAQIAAKSDAHSWNWVADTATTPGFVRLDTPRSKLLATRRPGQQVDFHGVSITPGPTRHDFAVVTLTALDGPDFQTPGRILVTATGDAENTGMTWTSPAHDSVGRDWGRRPSLVEGVPVTLLFPIPVRRLRAFALDANGQRRAPLALEGDARESRVNLGPEHATLWYEIEILP